MPIRLNPSPTFIAPISLSVPGQPPAQLKLEFRHLDETEVKALFAAALSPAEVKRIATAVAAAPDPVDSATLVAVMALCDLHSRHATEADLLARIIVSWPDGPINEAGLPVAYTDAALRQLLANYHAAGKEITRQYLRALTESSLGN